MKCQPSVLHIRLRSILLLVTAAAIGCAVLAPSFRQWEPAQQWYFLMELALYIVTGIVAASVMCGLRWRAERACQPVFSILAPYARYYRPWISFAMGILWFSVLIFFLSIVTFRTAHLRALGSGRDPLFFVVPVMASGNATMAFIQNWWGYRNRLIEIGLHGIVRQGIISLNWLSIRGLDWNETTGELKGNFRFFPAMPLEIPLEYREQLTQILRDKNLLKSPHDAINKE